MHQAGTGDADGEAAGRGGGRGAAFTHYMALHRSPHQKTGLQRALNVIKNNSRDQTEDHLF